MHYISEFSEVSLTPKPLFTIALLIPTTLPLAMLISQKSNRPRFYRSSTFNWSPQQKVVSLRPHHQTPRIPRTQSHIHFGTHVQKTRLKIQSRPSQTPLGRNSHGKCLQSYHMAKPTRCFNRSHSKTPQHATTPTHSTPRAIWYQPPVLSERWQEHSLAIA